MVEYRVIKYCRLCKKRLVHERANKDVYCSDCLVRVRKYSDKNLSD